MKRRAESQPRSRPLDPATIAVIAGREGSEGAPLNQPPVFASAFRAGGEHDYARASNPTWDAFETALGALEGGVAVSFGSGIAAAGAVLETVAPGGRILAANSAYVEVRRMLAAREAAGLVHVTYADPLDVEAIIDGARDADLVWLDAISNPTLRVPELDLIAGRIAVTETVLVVDSTLATPLMLRPLELGADLVIHSATKFIGGHSDILLGAAVARDPRVALALREARTAGGAVPGTMDAWLGLRGIRTLALRLERGSQSAGVLAERLEAHPRVLSVSYPGLATDPSHETAVRLLEGFGAVVAFELEGPDRAGEVCEHVELITHASSLGGVETLIDRPGRWQAGPGLDPALVRISVGCEDVEDLWADLERALGGP